MDLLPIPQPTDFEKFLATCDDPINAWDTKLARKELTNASIDWILSLAEWTKLITLTFRDETYQDVAMAKFKHLVRSLNREVFGKNYTRKVGHSYFSYALGIEYQKRGVIHFHTIVDRPVNFSRIHTLWNDWAGFVWIDDIKNKPDCVGYIAKYNLKGGQNEVYIAKDRFTPTVIPIWWKENQEQLRLFDACPEESSGREDVGHSGQN